MKGRLQKNNFNSNTSGLPTGTHIAVLNVMYLIPSHAKGRAMKTILGFSVYPSLNNNQKGITNPIGELSQLSISFSREVGTYTNTDQAGTAF